MGDPLRDYLDSKGYSHGDLVPEVTESSQEKTPVSVDMTLVDGRVVITRSQGPTKN